MLAISNALKCCGGPGNLVCLFAQVMDFLPWKTFHRGVARYEGNRGVRALYWAEQYRVLAFAQLTGRQSLRDIEASLSAQSAKLYPMGIRSPVRRSSIDRAMRPNPMAIPTN